MATPRIVEIYPPNPRSAVPLGVRINDTVYSTNLTGADLTTGKYVDGIDGQAAQALENMRVLMERAGGSIDNVGRVSAYVDSVEHREAFYKPWDLMYPDSSDRPAAHVVVAPLPPGRLIQLEMLALLGARRERIDIQGISARDPTVKIGGWVLTSRLHGSDARTGQLAEGFEAQAPLAYQNAKILVELAGGKESNITQILVFLQEASNADLAREQFEKAFPNPEERPHFYSEVAYMAPRMDL